MAMGDWWDIQSWGLDPANIAAYNRNHHQVRAVRSALTGKPNTGPATPNSYSPPPSRTIQSPGPEPVGARTTSPQAPAAQQPDPYAEYLSNLNAAQNPYSEGDPRFQSYMQSQVAGYARNFGSQQQDLAGMLASRGLMGSGLEAASRTALAGQQAAGLSDLQGRLAGEQLQRGADWDDRRRQMILQALGGQSQRQLGFDSLSQRGREFDASHALQAELGRGQLGAELGRNQLMRDRYDLESNPFYIGANVLAGFGGRMLGRY